MTLTPVNLAALGQELQNDPAAIGYSPHIASGDDGGLAALLNAPRTGQTCPCGALPPQYLVGKVLLHEVPVASLPAFASAWQSIAEAGGGFDFNNVDVWAVVGEFFATTTQTYANLSALKTISGCSRAEALFGHYAVIAASDVADALGR